jgi:hypothetical protein
MRTSVLACAACGFSSLLTVGAGTSLGTVHIAAAAHAETVAPLTPALCPVGSLPDGDACVRPAADDDGAPESEASVNAHHDRRGRWVVYDQIPRRPDRPADYDAYRYPVPCDHGCVVSGYDLDRPDEAQRRGRRLSHVGHGAVDIPKKKGTPITLVELEHQEGTAQVVYVGPLFGTTVLTRHAVREAGQLRDYLVLFGHLDTTAPGLSPGSVLHAGDPVGTVGDSGSPELVHLHLETRRVREGVDVSRLSPGAAIDNAASVVCDPRNVLPLR